MLLCQIVDKATFFCIITNGIIERNCILEEEEMNKIKELNWKKIGIIAGAVVGGLLLIYLIFSIYFMSHFFFRSTVNGVASSGKSPSSMVEKIANQAKDYSISITDEDGSVTTIKSEEVDMEVNATEDKLKDLLKEQSGFAWLKYIFTDKEYVSDDIVKINDEKLSAILSNMNCVQRDAQTPTENAKVVFNNDKYEIKPEVFGNSIEIGDFTSKINAEMTSFTEKVDVKDCYVKPTLLSNDANLAKSCEKLNNKININITYQVGSKTESIPKERLASFLTTDDKGDVSYNDGEIAAFVKEMANKYNTAGGSKQLQTSYGAVVTVPGGSYGWKIDQSGEAAKLKEDIEAGKDVTRDFVYKQKANSRDGNDYGDSYIEINLTAQHVIVYKNGSRVFETDCVTGNPFKGNATPTGAYFINAMQRNAVLRGADYETPVSYWMPFNGNVGLHDLGSRGAFGGQIYRTNGSHGCVNLPPSAAAQIFSLVNAGYPVLVYQLGGTESISQEIEAGRAVKGLIDSIGEVTPDKAGVIAEARAQFEALPREAKQVVDNIQVLIDAEAAIEAMGGGAPAPQPAPEG